MKLKEHLKELEDKDFTIVENVEENVLMSYDVTYKFAGKTLTENVKVAGLSKKTTKKKLEELKNKLKSKIRFVTESTAQMGNPGTDIHAQTHPSYHEADPAPAAWSAK